MKVIMTGGGTGGHIYPAIAIAEEIKRRDTDAEIIFVGTNHGMEKDIVPRYGYELKFITVSGLNRKKLWKNVQTVRDLKKGTNEARAVIREFQPDLVIGTGGYVCGPMVRTAASMGIRTYIHEQNAFPGLTNKLLSRKVNRVFIAFEDAAGYFKTKDRPVVVGNPVRKSFAETSREEARRLLGIDPEDFVVLSFGGSLGAKKINDEMKIAAEDLKDRKGLRIFFVTGKRYYDEIVENADPAESRVTYLKYIDNMPAYLSACNLAITRSGALTVSEIAACGRASVMIPSPYVTNNHQFFNAKVASDRAASILIEEKDLKPGMISELIGKLMNDRARVERMENNSRNLGRTDAADVMCDIMGI